MRLRLSIVGIASVAVSVVGLAGPAEAADGGPSFSGCISETGSGGACTDGSTLDGIQSVAVSTDRNSVYTAAANSDAIDVFTRDTDTGALTYASCYADTGTGTSNSCPHRSALDGVNSVTVAPGSRYVYATAIDSDAITVFQRSFTNGALTPASCISETGTESGCANGVALDGVSSIAISPDGANAYAASTVSDSLVVFHRDVDTGALTFASCFSQTGTGGICTGGGPTGATLDGADNVTVAPDGNNVYLASSGGDAVASFARNPTTGALTPLSCLAKTTATGCTANAALDNVKQITVAPDGKNAYAASWDGSALAIFNRDATTGALTAASPACISDTGTGGTCVDGSNLGHVASVAVSPDNKKVYAAAFDSNAIVAFDRNTTTGALTQAGCISETGSSGSCTDGAGLEGPSWVTVSPDGFNAYAASYLSAAVDTFNLRTDVYRFWSSRFNNAHFFTATKSEADNLRATDPNWTYEGVAFKVRDVTSGTCAVGSPVFRFWSATFASHFYTISTTERDTVKNDPNWSYEGPAYCAFQTHVAGTTALYRFWSPVFHKHFFTANAAEAEHLRTSDPNWTDEGAAYYVLP